MWSYHVCLFQENMGELGCLLLILVAAITVNRGIEGCSEATCGPRVSKCMLIGSCNCTIAVLTECTCCTECQRCLDNLFAECCSCVGLCPVPKDLDPSVTMKSYIEELNTEEDQTELFNILTQEPDPNLRWTSFSFPAVETAFFYKDKDGRKSAEEDTTALPEYLQGVNCTVAFMSQCASLEKCRSFCQSMGSSSYRWFHNGCCECVGKTCLNYGLRDAKCLKCSENDFEEENVLGRVEL